MPVDQPQSRGTWTWRHRGGCSTSYVDAVLVGDQPQILDTVVVDEEETLLAVSGGRPRVDAGREVVANAA